jgi:predicted ArsR family transcriptional regulator
VSCPRWDRTPIQVAKQSTVEVLLFRKRRNFVDASGERTIGFIAKELGVSKKTVYRHLSNAH